MKEARLQIRVTARTKRDATSLAARSGLTLSAMVEELLKRAVEADKTKRKSGAHNPGEVEQV